MRWIGNSVKETTGDKRAMLVPSDLNHCREGWKVGTARTKVLMRSFHVVWLFGLSLGWLIEEAQWLWCATVTPIGKGTILEGRSGPPSGLITLATVTLEPSDCSTSNPTPTRAWPSVWSHNTEVNFLLAVLACRTIINPPWQLSQGLLVSGWGTPWRIMLIQYFVVSNSKHTELVLEGNRKRLWSEWQMVPNSEGRKMWDGWVEGNGG